jgi:hypothetical protein
MEMGFMWAKTKIIQLGQVLGQEIWRFGATFNSGFNKNLLNLSLSKAWLVSLILCSTLFLVACGDSSSNATSGNPTKISTKAKTATIAEVSAPDTIQKLNRLFDRYEPQLKILSPAADQIIADTNAAVKLEVRDLPIFKDAQFGLGSHVQVLLDNQAVESVYDLSQPLVFENLSVGTHTLRAFVERPWHESFKNEGAYAQTTFHVYTKTGENTPSPQVPLLTYGYPTEQVGTEPLLLDFQLHNAPLHLAAIADENLTDWRIRVSLNDDSFLVDQWQPIYLKGLKPGKNLVKLELLDAKGAPILNQFNTTAKLIAYQPGSKDLISRLFRNEAIAGIEAIVDPNYKENSEKAQTASVSSSIAAKNLSASVDASVSSSIDSSISQSFSQSTRLASEASVKSKSLSQSIRKEESSAVSTIKTEGTETKVNSPSVSQTDSQTVNKSEPPVFTSSTARPIQSNTVQPAQSKLNAKSTSAIPQTIPQAGAPAKAPSPITSQKELKTKAVSRVTQSLTAEPKLIPQATNSKPKSPSWFEKATQKRTKSAAISQPVLIEPEVTKENEIAPKMESIEKLPIE